MEQDKIWNTIQIDPDLVNQGCNDHGRLKFISKKISGGSVLNIGVGSGNLEKILLSRGLSMFSLDPSEGTIKKINNLGSQGRVGRIEYIPFNDSSFDYVVVSEVLEHLDDDTLASGLKEIYRVLKLGGKLLGTVPADEKLQSSLCICPNCGDKYHRWGHVQSFSERRLSNVIKKVFDECLVRRIHFFDLHQLSPAGKIVSILKYVLAKAGYKGSGQNFFFRAKK